MFGMSNNYSSYTLQPGQKDDQGFFKNGSIVLILCLNGSPDANQAIILGGLQNPNQSVYSAEDGQFYDFNFNGIKYNINKDGELSIQFNSVIDGDGNQANPDAAGTTLKFDKDGGFTVSDNENQSVSLSRKDKTITISNGDESIVVDKGNKIISVNSSQDIKTSSQQSTDISAKQDVNVSASSNLSLQADQNLSINSGQNINAQAGQNWQIQAGSNVTVSSQGTVVIQSPTVVIQGETTLIGASPSAPVALAAVSQIVAFLGPIPLPGNIITGSTTILGSP